MTTRWEEISKFMTEAEYHEQDCCCTCKHVSEESPQYEDTDHVDYFCMRKNMRALVEAHSICKYFKSLYTKKKEKK